MRASTAYFVGAGTVVVAIATGLGGGLLLGNIMSPQQPKHPSSEVTRLEQRASPQPIPAMTGATQPVPYMAPTQVRAAVAEPSAQPQQQETPPQQGQQIQPQQAQPQVHEASTQASEPKQPERNPSPQSAAAAPPTAPVEQPVARERATPEDSFAKARDADLKRDARRAEDRDRRKAERRQQWAEKRKLRPREDDDLADVEASVRDATESRPLFRREQRRELGFFGREAGSGQGRANLFDDD